MQQINYRIEVDTDEPEQRLALLHTNVRKYRTIYNAIAAGTELQGTLARM